MKSVVIDNKFFELILSKETIHDRIEIMAKSIDLIFDKADCIDAIVLMNGAFIFAADLTRQLDNVQLHFIKTSSYQGFNNSGEVFIQQIDYKIFVNKNVLIIEDIIESGNTVKELMNKLHNIPIRKLVIATLVLKPGKLLYSFDDLIAGFEIDDQFIIGYGMDYNESGRNLPGIYQLRN